MKIIEKIKSSSRSVKIQLAIALALSVALGIVAPVYAWFNYERKLAERAKVKSPDNLYINAAHKEDIMYLDMSSINVSQVVPGTETPVTSESFVFSVSGEWVTNYTLQIEHTTNNPYTYSFHEGKIYESLEDMKADDPAGYKTEYPDTYAAKYDERDPVTHALKYVKYTASNVYDAKELKKISGWPNYPPDDVASIQAGSTYYVWIGDVITNKDGDHGDYITVSADKSYGSSTHYDSRVVPRYWQLKKILTKSAKNVPFYNTYVITATWTGVNNIPSYKKETDLFYISAFVGNS